MPALLVLAMLVDLQSLPPQDSTERRTIEVGGERHLTSAGQPDWTLARLALFWNPPVKFRPVIEIDRQSRARRSQARVSAGAYVDWSRRVYTLQSFSVGEHVPTKSRYFALRRGDVRAFVKLGSQQRIVLAGGVSTLTFGDDRDAQIYNLGLLAYRGLTITQITGYVNRTDPGGLVSAAANVALQHGLEGRAWYGGSFGAGREIYRVGDGLGAANADFTTVTGSVFARKWIAGSLGIHTALEYQRFLDSYSRLGFSARVFVDF